MIKIMFVCHGNICRSPMAEFILKDMVSKNDQEENFYISSSATSYEEIGSSVYPKAKAELKKHGISCDGKYAVHLEKSDYDKYDLFIGMDDANIRNMLRIFGSDPQNKIKKLKSYTTGGDVADPWYTGDFSQAYNDIYNACYSLLAGCLKL